MSSSEEFDEKEGNNNIEIESQSDVKSNDSYNDDDYYNDNIEEYKIAEPLPSIEPPKEISFTPRRTNDNRPAHAANETFMNFNEKFQKIKNDDYYNEDEFPTASAEEICENYKTSYSLNIDYSSNNYDIFSKNHLRNTLIEQIKKIDWKNQGTKINEAKKETNAYEDIVEKFFYNKQSYQLANINSLFEKKLYANDNLYNGIPVFIVGDNGGLTDCIMYYTIEKGGYFPTIFVIPEKNNEIKKAKFRKEINDKINDHVEILYEFYQENKDLDENTNISTDFINDIANKIIEKTEEYKVNLYIARKTIKFSPDASQEIKYKKFLLINILLAFKVLNSGGNFIIKLYDTFTPFTIGLIYMIFKNFERVSIFKPVSTRQYSPSRFLVAENYLKNRDDETNNSIKYLENFLTKYIDFLSNNYDVKLFLPSSELRKNENFLKIIPEINNDITEKRIDSLKEIINYLDKKKTKLYDKMSIRKFFLDNWGVPVINYDEKKLLKNQTNKGARNYHNPQKVYTEEELAEAYKNVGNFDDDQLKMLKLMKKGNKKNKKKPIIEEDRPKIKEDNLEEKYKILDQIFNKKKTNNNKRVKKDNNIKDNESNKKVKKKQKEEEDKKDIELLKKKTERNKKKPEQKSKKKNKDLKKEDEEDNFLSLKEEFSKLSQELSKKIEK